MEKATWVEVQPQLYRGTKLHLPSYCVVYHHEDLLNLITMQLTLRLGFFVAQLLHLSPSSSYYHHRNAPDSISSTEPISKASTWDSHVQYRLLHVYKAMITLRWLQHSSSVPLSFLFHLNLRLRLAFFVIANAPYLRVSCRESAR